MANTNTTSTTSSHNNVSLSPIGSNPFGSGSKLFGSSVSPPQFGTTQSQNTFSQRSTPAPVFGDVSKSSTSSPLSGAGLFSAGSPVSQNPFQIQSPFSAVSPAGTLASSNSGISPKSPPVFGNNAPTSQPSALFGNNVTPQASTSTSALFGSKNFTTSTSSFAPSSSVPVFGMFSKKDGDGTTNNELFKAKSDQVSSSSKDSSSEMVFGSQFKASNAPSSTMFSSDANKSSLLGSQFKASNAPSSTMFSSDANKSSLLFGKTQAPVSSSSTATFSFQANKNQTSSLLFGKPVSTSQSVQSGQLASSSFNSKPTSAILPVQSSQREATSFSSGGTSSALLFGKPVNRNAVENAESKERADMINERADMINERAEEYTTKDDDDDSRGLPMTSIGRWKSARKVAMPLGRRRSLIAAASSKSATDVSGEAVPSKSLVVVNIPPRYCDKELLRHHFSKYGTIVLLRVTQEKHSAAITFDSKESAQSAKEATFIDKESPPMDIFYRHSPQTKRSVSKILKDPKKKTVSQDVENELRSMGELPEFEMEPASYSSVSRKPGRSRHRTPTPPKHRSPSPTPHTSVTVPQDKEDSHAPPDLNTIKGLLKTLHQAKAMETNDRIAVLDKRDQLLKLLRGRQQADLASAKAFEGCCRDMCPEKERYYREDTRRLALYEIIPSTISTVTGQKTKVDHTKAVKEYSRSSADQVEPLPHELRPLTVLQLTMVYLLQNVADLGGDGKWSEWYDFFWNRTRGIRKDITQQQLCHVQVAHLLEQCARFHIFCSERLCEEDMMTFDAKINNENLTKCLQTLKELYSDLESKHNCYCQNEAEIRAYIVLMNLNQGDTLREVQQLRPEIRDSPQIRFAVEAYNALNSSNYVRFFRLIKKTTFLNGCILHRYFNQIRSKALHIIRKAMATAGKSMSYPVSEMIRLLCFENSTEVIEFCSHYGLKVDSSAVTLEGPFYSEPEGSLPQKRSITLVESKRRVSVGETIYGGPLPAVIIPEPFSSFDAEGHFIFTPEFQQALASNGLKIPPQIGEILSRGVSAGPMVDSPPAQLVAVPETQKLPLARDVVRMPYSNEAIKSAARALILEETDSQAVRLAHEVWESERNLQTCIETNMKLILDSAVLDNVKSVAAEVVEETEKELRNALEVASRKQRSMEGVRDSLMDEVLDAMVKEVTKEEWRIVEDKRHRLTMDQCAQSCSTNIFDLVVKELTVDVASEVYQMDVVAKRNRLADTEDRILSKKMRHYFQIWQRAYIKRLRVKRAMLDFPVAPSTRSHSEQLSALIPLRPTDRLTGDTFYVGEKAKLTLQSPMNILESNLHLSARLSMASAQQMLSGLRMWQPLDIVDTASRQLVSLFQEWKDCDIVEKDASYIQWKLVLSSPSQRSNEEADFVQWVKTKFGQKSEESDKNATSAVEGEILSKYTTHLMSSQSTKALSLSFCVRSFRGNWNDTQATGVVTKEVLKGMSGLVFIASDAEAFMSDEACWKKDCIRLRQLLTKKAKAPAVPIVIVIPRLTSDVCVSSDILSEHLELPSLHQKGLVSYVHFAQPCIASDQWDADYSNEWTTQLSNCIRFLASRIPAPPTLAVKSLADYVEDCVVEYYKAQVYQDLRTRTRLQLLHQSPNKLLTLYNDIIDHLAMVIASDSLTKCSWPAPEFDQKTQGLKSDWNSQGHLCDLYELIANLRLPFFHYSDMEAHDWDLACKDVWKFVDSVTSKDSGSAKICLYQRVIDIFHTTKKRFDQFCWLASEEEDNEPSYVNMAWTDLIDACIHYKMVSLRTGHLRLRKPEDDKKEQSPPEEDDFEDINVFFLQSELEDYEIPSSWEEALRDTETVASLHVKETVMKKSGVKRIRDSSETFDDRTMKVRKLDDASNRAGNKPFYSISDKIKNKKSVTFIQNNSMVDNKNITLTSNNDPLADKFMALKEEIEKQKHLDALYEKQLKKWIGSDLNSPVL